MKDFLKDPGIKIMIVILVIFIALFTPVWSRQAGEFVWAPILISIGFFFFVLLMKTIFKNNP